MSNFDQLPKQIQEKASGPKDFKFTDSLMTESVKREDGTLARSLKLFTKEDISDWIVESAETKEDGLQIILIKRKKGK